MMWGDGAGIEAGETLVVGLFFSAGIPSHENLSARPPKRICILAQLLFLRNKKLTYSSDSDVRFSKNPQAAKGKGKQKIYLMGKKRQLVRRKASASRGSGN